MIIVPFSLLYKLLLLLHCILPCNKSFRICWLNFRFFAKRRWERKKWQVQKRRKRKYIIQPNCIRIKKKICRRKLFAPELFFCSQNLWCAYIAIGFETKEREQKKVYTQSLQHFYIIKKGNFSIVSTIGKSLKLFRNLVFVETRVPSHLSFGKNRLLKVGEGLFAPIHLFHCAFQKSLHKELPRCFHELTIAVFFRIEN
jgi:hypothetical protein